MFPGSAALFSLMLFQSIGFRLGQSTVLGLVWGQPAGFEGAVIQKDVDAA